MMSGGLMQLIAYGAQDVYLTGNPTIPYLAKQQYLKVIKELEQRFDDQATHRIKIESVNIEIRLIPGRGIDYYELVQKYQNHSFFRLG